MRVAARTLVIAGWLLASLGAAVAPDFGEFLVVWTDGWNDGTLQTDVYPKVLWAP